MLVQLSIVLLSLSLAEAVELKCNEAEQEEAVFAYRNCEDSAKATIFSKEAKPDDDLCQILNNLFVGCEAQLARLAECKDAGHVENIKKISRLSLATVLDNIRPDNRGTKATQCPIVRPTTTTTTTTTTARAPDKSSVHHQPRRTAATGGASSSSSYLQSANNNLYCILVPVLWSLVVLRLR